MARRLLPLAFVVAVLLTVSALPVCVATSPADTQTAFTPVADTGDALPDVPPELSRGIDGPPANPSDSQRRIEAPERLESPLRQLVVTSGPAPRSAMSALGRFTAVTAAPIDSTAATPLHLRHCVFLC